MIRPRAGGYLGIALGSACLLLAAGSPRSTADGVGEPTALIGIGDSLTHGTMDATNNAINTSHAYLQRVRNALAQRINVIFSQPYYDLEENRIDPTRIPTNLAVDGADSFTVEGLEYYLRAGVDETLPSPGLMSDKLFPSQFSDDYDKVIYPINVRAGRPITQVGAAEWLLAQGLPAAGITKAITVYWVGNNDSSTSALGLGGSNPMFLPFPADQLVPVLPLISILLKVGESQGVVSLAPYSPAAIDRNLTVLEDFTGQNGHLLARLNAASAASGVDNQVFVLTLPYYSSVGYLFDSEDLEFYLRKVAPTYRVPPTFARVAPIGQPITDPLKGDRISVLTFGLMYTLLGTGFPVSFVNQVLEKDGLQNDGLVLSESEQAEIRTRIDGFNDALRAQAAAAGPNVHVVEIGPLLNAVLTGQIPVTIGGKQITRKWIRGSSFGFDGVHPGYLGQAFISNFVLSRINAEMGLDAPLSSLPTVMATDPYVDNDGDGWAAGPDYTHTGITDLLFLLKDPDDGDAEAQVVLPDDVWTIIRNALLSDLLRSAPQLTPEAERLGLRLPPRAAAEGDAAR